MKGGIHRAASVDRYQLVTSSLCMDINEMPCKVFHRIKANKSKVGCALNGHASEWKGNHCTQVLLNISTDSLWTIYI